MSGPKKPPENSICSLAPVTSATPPLHLTRDEMSMLSAFREMDGKRKGEAVVRMQRIAGKFPWRVAPRLRLIAGGAQ